MRFPNSVWQIGITLTFCYSAIDLLQDVLPDASTDTPFTLYFLLIFLMTLIVGLLTAWFQRQEKILRNMFFVLTGACIVVAFIRLGLLEKSNDTASLSFFVFVCRHYFVHIIFTLSAIYISWLSYKISSASGSWKRFNM
jgi:hypothetical protein